MPRSFTIEPRDKSIPILEVAIEDGSPACNALRRQEGGPPLTAATVRRAIGHLIRDVAREVAVSPTGERYKGIPIARRVIDPHERVDLKKALTRRRQGARVDDDFLEKVASIYRRALDQGEAPTEAVKTVLHGSRSSAGRWVEQARRRGFLPPTTAGRARA
jgi:hypothetical protein